MAINYLRRVQARYQGQGQSDVERGIASGEAIGKLLGNLGTAIQGAQKNAIANKLMTDQDIASQPGAGKTQDLGTLPGGPQPGPPDQGNTVDPGADLSTDLPEDVSSQLSTTTPTQTYTNPATGNIEPLQGQAPPQTYSGTNTDPLVASNVASAKAAQSLSPPGDFALNPSDYSGGGKTVGGLIHTGGVQEMELQKEMLAMQMQKAQLAKANAPPKAPDPVDVALKQVQLAQARKNLLKPDAVTKTAVDKTSLATNMDTEPVEDQSQLVRTYESTHGKGSFDDTVSAFNAPDSVPDPDHPGQTLPNGPKISGNSVTLNPNSKNPVSLQLNEAQTLAKQLNARRIAQGLPPIPVPGTDSSLGSSRANPIPVQTKLDGASVPKGKWIRTPTGAIIQRP